PNKLFADHLHLRSDKARGVRIREKARLVSKGDQENSCNLSGTDDDINQQ
ncbi:hypothetical protein VP01_14709g1, partial [Puccinia sorghi]